MSTQLELNNIIATSGNFSNALTVNTTGVSLSGHTHTSSQISDFNSSVSGLVSGTYAPLSGATFTGPITATSGNFTYSLQVNGTGVSISGHTHTASAISDSTTAGRAILMAVDASAQRTSLGLGTIATLASGTYALASHTHTSSDITNFNSSVSGLVSGVYAPLSGKLNQFASTTSAELFSVISDETGSGILVFNTNPVFSGNITAPTGNFTTNLQVGSTSLTTNDILNIINSTNLYLWSNFR